MESLQRPDDGHLVAMHNPLFYSECISPGKHVVRLAALKDKKSRGSECLTTGQPRRSKLLRSKELCHSA